MFSGGPCADAGMLVSKEVLLRGARANPKSSLGSFVNVGGMSKEPRAKARIPGSKEIVPFVKRAHDALDEDPLDQLKVASPEHEEPARLRNSDLWSDHLKRLQYDDHLFEDYKGDEEIARRIAGRYTAVWKDVDKTPPIARAIMDLRRLNALCGDQGVPFEILCPAHIVKELRLIDPTKRWGIVHADVANAYYQMGTGPKLKQRMLIRWGSKFIQSQVLAMGFTRSCGIAQGIFMGLIILRSSGDDDLGIPESVYLRDVAPGCVHLQNGGLIVLVYDSILIICPQGDCKKWYERLKRNFEKIGHVVFKYCKISAEREIVPYCGVELRIAPNLFQWRVSDATLQTWGTLRGLAVRNSPRTLFKIVSFLRFACDIQGAPRRVLGRVSRAQSKLGLVIHWDDLIVDRKDIEAAWSILDKITRERAEGRDWRHRKSHLPMKRCNVGHITFLIVAVDATPYRYAAALLEADGSCKTKCEGNFEHALPIAEAEGTAACKGLVLVGDIGADVIALCNDHKAVGRGFWKGYSPTDNIDDLVVEGLHAVDGKVLIDVDVPSAENFADIGTRPTKNFSENEHKMRMQMSLARGRYAVARWEKTGQDYCPRESFLVDENDFDNARWDVTPWLLQYDSNEE